MKKRTRFEAVNEKSEGLKGAEEKGEVADSQEVRVALIKRMHAGEITLDEAQKELKNIKRNAAKNGLKTRSQVWKEG